LGKRLLLIPPIQGEHYLFTLHALAMTPDLKTYDTVLAETLLKNLTVHFLAVGLQVTDLDAASELRVDGGTEYGDGNWDLLVARNGGRDDKVANLKLSIHE
jgi:hypothetical protein